MAKVRVGCVGLGFMGKMHFGVLQGASGRRGGRHRRRRRRETRRRLVQDRRQHRRRQRGQGRPRPASRHTRTPTSSSRTPTSTSSTSRCPPSSTSATSSRPSRPASTSSARSPWRSTSQEADKIVAAAKKSKGKFMAAHCIRFWPEYDWLAQIIKGKKYGRVKSAVFKPPQRRPYLGLAELAHERKALRRRRARPAHPRHATTSTTSSAFPRRSTPPASPAPRAASTISSPISTTAKTCSSSAEGGWIFHGSYPFEMAFTFVFDKATVEFSTSQSPTLKIYTSGGKVESPNIPAGDGYHGRSITSSTASRRTRSPRPSPRRTPGWRSISCGPRSVRLRTIETSP